VLCLVLIWVYVTGVVLSCFERVCCDYLCYAISGIFFCVFLVVLQVDCAVKIVLRKAAFY